MCVNVAQPSTDGWVYVNTKCFLPQRENFEEKWNILPKFFDIDGRCIKVLDLMKESWCFLNSELIWMPPLILRFFGELKPRGSYSVSNSRYDLFNVSRTLRIKFIGSDSNGKWLLMWTVVDLASRGEILQKHWQLLMPVHLKSIVVRSHPH